MQKRFIVLVDFSEYSANLIKYAYDWSKRVNAGLLFVHQIDASETAFGGQERTHQIEGQLKDEAILKLKDLTGFIPQSANVSYSVSTKHLTLTLEELLAEPFDNLILLGLKGTGLLKQIFIGSMALQVIDSVKNIVVAMPKEVDSFSHKKIYVAATEKYPLNLLELNNFLEFVSTPDISITFFHLAKPNEMSKEMVNYLGELTEFFADRYKVDFEVFEGNDPFHDLVRNMISGKSHKLLIVQRGSRVLSDQLFRKFLINQLVYEGRTPLVVLP